VQYDLVLQRDAIQQDLAAARLKGDYASVARLQAVWEKTRAKVQDTSEGETPQPSIYVIELNVGKGDSAENKIIDITHLQKLSPEEIQEIDEAVESIGFSEAEMLKMLKEGSE
jgi:hypothetical protein